MHPETFLRVLGPEPWKVAYVQPSRRPTDGRYGDNPNRLYKHHQYQVILKPSPANVQDLYLDSLRALGIEPADHDVRFEEDNWESPALGAWGIGWQVLLDGQEITQFTYFQQAGGINLSPISAEITYGLERIAMYLQDKADVFDVEWTAGVPYRAVRHEEEFELSRYSFELADVDLHMKLFEGALGEAKRLLETAGPRVSPRRLRLGAARVACLQRPRCPGRDLRDPARVDAAPDPEARLRGRRRPRRRPVARCAEGTRPNVAEFLFEIGFEEMPAPWLSGLADQLEAKFTALASGEQLAPADVRVLWTSRRLVLVADVNARQDDRTVVEWGPAAKIAKDAAGNWSKAAEGFAKKQGVGARCAQTRAQGRGLGRSLRQRDEADRGSADGRGARGHFCLRVLRGFNFPKRMNWDAWLDDGRGAFEFGRPIQWLVALLDGEVVPVTIYDAVAGARGAPRVVSGRRSMGNRFYPRGRVRSRLRRPIVRGTRGRSRVARS